MGSRGQRPQMLWGFTYFECIRKALLDLLICIFMIKKDTDYGGGGVKYKSDKIDDVYELLCLDLKQVACFTCNLC